MYSLKGDISWSSVKWNKDRSRSVQTAFTGSTRGASAAAGPRLASLALAFPCVLNVSNRLLTAPAGILQACRA